MASGLSKFAARKVVDKLNGVSDFTPPTSYWVALFTHASADSFLRENNLASALEVSGGSYARIEVRGATGIDWPASDVNAESSNDSIIVFPQATGPWGTVTAAALIDANSAGNVWWYGALTAPKTVGAPDVFRIGIGQFLTRA